MANTHAVMLVGATGLVGRECLRLLSADPVFSRIVVPTRRALPDQVVPAPGAAKLECHVIDFDRLPAYAHLFSTDQIICALGTTIEQARSRERFREVDFAYPLSIARLGIDHGAEHFLLVSALGASARSRSFYNRVKGELEDAVRALPYRSITIVRPSLLLGDREQPRFGEEIGKRLAFLVPRRYRPVAATAVAAALVRVAREDAPGHRIVESVQIRPLADDYFASAGSPPSRR